MSIVHPKSQWQWLLLLLLSFVLVQAFETPSESSSSSSQCEHDSIPDLIKSSPVILKALGARIFTDYESYPFQDDIEITEELILKAQQQRDVPAAAVIAAAAANRRSSSSSIASDARSNGGGSSSWSSRSSGNHLDDDNEDDDVSLSDDSVLTGTTFDGGSQWAAMTGAGAELTSTLITLTPVTIYKGASLLKVTQQPDGMNSASESSYQYEEQLNATLEPLACFDSNILKLLPTEIIAFGKLVSDQRPDVLRISINGLHRWSPQFENRIWKYLGWDDWSDFTLCSVQCGKGVQQRFRRCLLDNPMININMNNNMNGNEMQQGQQQQQQQQPPSEQQQQLQQDMLDVSSSSSSSSRSSSNSSPSNVPNQQKQHHNHHHHHHQQQQQQQMLLLHSKGSSSRSSSGSSSNSRSGSESSRSRNHSTSPEKDTSSNIGNGIKSTSTGRRGVTAAGGEIGEKGGGVLTVATDSISLNKLKKRRKRKKAKSLSTMSCEGYNIEQRNCNTFECTDDISDLLKFYKKFLPLEELPTTLVPQQPSESSMVQQQQQQMPTVSELALGFGATWSSSFSSSSSSSSSSSLSSVSGSSVPAALSTASTTLLPNTGYIRSWKNSLNFTLMITLRLKNDTKSTSTVFSIRNTTHNLYVETSADGLRLFQERDNATEMLPVKFQLYDNRWHQVSISFQNGDFISIYVDCTWTNSFVVSKRLFSLPNDADVEIGRGFSGELQQLLVLPDNQERHQCSNVRTSINEVKRYIIDTFIDDYGN